MTTTATTARKATRTTAIRVIRAIHIPHQADQPVTVTKVRVTDQGLRDQVCGQPVRLSSDIDMAVIHGGHDDLSVNRRATAVAEGMDLLTGATARRTPLRGPVIITGIDGTERLRQLDEGVMAPILDEATQRDTRLDDQVAAIIGG
ncbi:hypothetical protein [Kocuria palustris]|uniref:hypothetical protein n=1 Tax=Kocuria palustris TaxID=71999 RepID=UPI0020436AA9|nr:hypothetical protein [Kocuria palustris]MCM3332814.1 hypothetical protein [Kocuria palustris]